MVKKTSRSVTTVTVEINLNNVYIFTIFGSSVNTNNDGQPSNLDDMVQFNIW